MFATSFVLGYHGCDEAIGERILQNDDHVAVSRNRYDWLGEGAYFWENSPERALEWAAFLKNHPPQQIGGSGIRSWSARSSISEIALI
jgi:hypothetical protein